LRRVILDLVLAAVAHDARQVVHDAAQHTVRLTGLHLEWPDLIRHVVEDVAVVERTERAHSEIDRELQTWFAGGRLDPVGLLKEQDTETIEAGVLHGEPIFRLVHSEAARPT
jgi:hypothetical protein